MALAELCDPRAVRAAIDEYDQIGEEAFLSKYGFGRSRAYWVEYHGRRYASKALAGAAYGYQHGTALRAQDFSGGERTVRRRLEAMGFTVVVDRTGLPNVN